MKKILMTIAAVAFATTMNAQLYLGGSFGISGGTNTTDKIEDGGNVVSRDVKKFSLEVLPEIGYKINDNMAVGAEIGVDFTKETTPNYYYVGTGYLQYDTTVKGTYFNFNPYFRYIFVTWDKVSLFCDAQVGLRFGKGSTETPYYDPTTGAHLGNQTRDVKYSSYSFAIVPGIAYQASEKISVVAKLGKGLGYWHEKTTTPDQYTLPVVGTVQYDREDFDNTFGLNLKTLGLTVGVYYNF